MAAPMRSRSVHKFLRFSTDAFQKRFASARTGFYILIPEVPPDSPETNAIMRHRVLPQFAAIKPENTITGCAKMSLDFVAKLDAHTVNLSDMETPPTFEEIFHPIEELLAPLNFGFKTAQILFKTCYSKYTEMALRRVLGQVKKTKSERFNDEALLGAIMALYKRRESLTPVQLRLVDLYLLECRLSGVRIRSKKKEILNFLMKEQMEKEITFLQRSTTQKGLYYMDISPDQYTLVKGLPDATRVYVAYEKSQPDRGPWRITLLDFVYYDFLKTCPARENRREIWRRYNSTATQLTADIRGNNTPIVEEIRDARKRIANALGYMNYAKLSMETKMMGGVENVQSMLNEYKTAFVPAAEQEIFTLTEFARDGGLDDELKMWDIPYYRQEYCKEIFKVPDSDIVPYFPFERVLDGLFSLSSQLFNITIQKKEVDLSQKLDKDTLLYDVIDGDNTHLATLYLDPYMRSSKFRGTYTDHGRDRSDLTGCKPISYIMMSLTQPTLRIVPPFMTYKQVVELFYEFGHALQNMLTTVPYSDLSGQNNVEYDAMNVVAHVMKLFALQPHIINQMNSHHQSGEKLEADTVDRLLKEHSYLSAYDKCHELYKSAFDLECHISMEPMRTIQETMWQMFMPIDLDKHDWSPCSDTTMWFKRDNAAAYYSNICSEMLAIDCFESFKQVGLENTEAVSAVGKRFRETFLSMGGGTPALEVFRQFQGRDPSWSSLINHYGVRRK